MDNKSINFFGISDFIEKIIGNSLVIKLFFGVLLGIFSSILVYYFENRIINAFIIFVVIVCFLYNYFEGNFSSNFPEKYLKRISNLLFVVVVSFIVSEFILFQSVVFDRTTEPVMVNLVKKQILLSEEEINQIIILNKEEKNKDKNIDLYRTSFDVVIRTVINNSIVEKYTDINQKEADKLSKVVSIEQTKKYVPFLSYKSVYRYNYQEEEEK